MNAAGPMSSALQAVGELALAGIGLVLLVRRAPLATRDKTSPSYWRALRRIGRWIGGLALLVALALIAGRFTS
jgi:hypothetical protein